jgi:hypothetical protein
MGTAMTAIIGYREFAGPYKSLPVVDGVPDLDELYAVTDNYRRFRFAFPNGVSVTVDRWHDDFWLDVYRPPREGAEHHDCDDLALLMLLAAVSQEGGIAFVMTVDVGEFGPDWLFELIEDTPDAELVVCPPAMSARSA